MMTFTRLALAASAAALSLSLWAACGGSTERECEKTATCPCESQADCLGDVAECFVGTCTSGTCGTETAPEGAACSSGVCNGVGICVPDTATGGGGTGGVGPGGGGAGGGGAPPETLAVYATQRATCALVRRGETWCWGIHQYGGSEDPQPVPDQIPGTGVELALGSRHFCRRTIGGGVECWGDNGSGQLGNNTMNDAPTEVTVGGLQAQAIAAGGESTCAVNLDGQALCWGDNSADQVPGAPGVDALSPFNIQLSNTEQLSLGAQFGCATRTDSAWCWGSNLSEQADPTSTAMTISLPTFVSLGAASVVQVDAGGSNACAVLDDGTVWCWGFNGFGQFGGGGNPLAPFQVAGLSGVEKLSNSGSHVCAVRTDRTVWCWGLGGQGQLGLGSNSTQTTPTEVAGLTCDAVDVSTGDQHTCAACDDGTIWCWGSNLYGQLGTGGVGNNENVPTMVGAF